MQLGENRILFKPFPPKEKSEGGIYVPDSFKPESNRGTIEAVGYGTEKKEMRLKKGMVVHRVLNWGEQLIIDGEKYYLMEQDAIIAKE
jgi:co-chaperonin GroES (HSP10)